LLAEMLKRRGIQHQVLNAKYHEMEAQIVAQAGRFKGVTIATNMAGRGTDILLGGNPNFMAKNLALQTCKPDDPNFPDEYKRIFERYKQETQAEHDKVVGLGGLHVLGTERHEARRIDNQLRGRSGRQGDPGSSRFYVALEDELMRLFGSDRLMGLMNTLGLEEGQVIEHPWVSKSIEIAQRRVEQHNFEIRKQLLEYDNVMNKQREIIYSQRREILEGASLKENVHELLAKHIDELVMLHTGTEAGHEPDIVALVSAVKLKFGVEPVGAQLEKLGIEEIKSQIQQQLIRAYEEKERNFGEDLMRHLERMIYLQVLDSKWKDHLYAMDYLREGIGLRAYGQRDPLVEYKREAFNMFGQMITSIEDEALELVFKLQPAKSERFRGVFSEVNQEFSHPETTRFQAPQKELTEEGFQEAQSASPQKTVQSSHPKVGRNDACPCGSGKKYKKCCGK